MTYYLCDNNEETIWQHKSPSLYLIKRIRVSSQKEVLPCCLYENAIFIQFHSSFCTLKSSQHAKNDKLVFAGQLCVVVFFQIGLKILVVTYKHMAMSIFEANKNLPDK